jgi:hypothetical protein
LRRKERLASKVQERTGPLDAIVVTLDVLVPGHHGSRPAQAPASKLVGDSARIPAASVVKRCEVFAKIRRRGDERSQKSGLQSVNPHSERFAEWP